MLVVAALILSFDLRLVVIGRQSSPFHEMLILTNIRKN